MHAALIQPGGTHFQCPDCGFAQRSNAEHRITCHRCGRSYLRRKANMVTKTPDEDVGTGFVQYRPQE